MARATRTEPVQINEQMDKFTVERIDGQTDKQLEKYSLHAIGLFAAAAQKGDRR